MKKKNLPCPKSFFAKCYSILKKHLKVYSGKTDTPMLQVPWALLFYYFSFQMKWSHQDY